MRSIPGAVLAALLLVFSCVSARCDVVCELGTLHGCGAPDLAPAAMSAGSMAGMEDCGSSHAAMQSASGHFTANASCVAQLCTHDSVLPQDEQTMQLPLIAAENIAVLALHQPAVDHGSGESSKAPPFRRPSPLQSGTLLRV